MAPHSSVLAWRIPGTEEPRGLLSMGLHRVGHDGSDLASAATTTENYLVWKINTFDIRITDNKKFLGFSRNSIEFVDQFG